MSLNRPILLTTPSFDATKQKIFLFNVESGGAQIVANQLTIKNQNGNTIVYQEKQQSFRFEHVLPANTLKNGEYYSATVAVYDSLGNESPASLYIQFRCYTSPSIEFVNLPSNNIINNNTYEFQFIYNQEQGERLDNYVMNLYNSSQVLVSTSSVVYVGNGSPPYTGSYLFAGFEDNTVYYLEIIGATINGAVVETGKIQIDISYVKPDLFTLLSLKNNCDEGYISVASNIVLIGSETNPAPPIFIDGKEVDLSGEGNYVDWNSGYSVNGNFLARAWFRNPNVNSQIIQFSNVMGQTIKVTYRNGYENVEASNLQSYVEVYVKSIDGLEYYIYSNYTNILSQLEYYMVYLRRIDNIYEIKLLPLKENIRREVET